MDEERIVNIETKLSYQDDLLDQLNKIVIEQQAKIDEVSEAARLLIERINEMTETGVSAGGESQEKPPHY